jgi:hypothetical protein
MKLFTQEIDRKLFSQYNLGSDLSKQMVVAKIFNPYGAGRWFLINSDPQDPDYLWAIVDLFDIEVGSVSRTELQSIRIGKHGLPLERDLYFKPINAQELLDGLMQGQYYKKGGLVHNQNKEMLENQAKEFMHHSKELNSLVGKTKEVDAWVVAKAERATTDLSDITHYLDGRMEYGGMMSKSAEDTWNNLQKGERVNFLFDHRQEIEDYGGSEYGELTRDKLTKAYNSDWKDLDINIRNIYDNYLKEGVYGTRGLLEVYKGYGIVDTNGVIEVVSPNGSRFIVGLDDSKMSGSRKSIEMTREQELASAKDYIDWLTKSKMAKGGYVAVSEKDDYWYIMSKPTTKEKAQELVDMGVPRGEVGKVVTIAEAKAHKKVIGKEYLASGGMMGVEGISNFGKTKGFDSYESKGIYDNRGLALKPTSDLKTLGSKLLIKQAENKMFYWCLVLENGKIYKKSESLFNTSQDAINDYMKQSFAKGGMVVTSIKDIPNFKQRLDEGKITYRGLGLGKKFNDFYDLAGESGTRIKVDGKEYYITETEFNTFSRGEDGKMRIRFDAPYRKFNEGGEMAKGGMLKAILVHKEFGVEYYKNGSLIQPTKEEKLKWELYGLPNDIEKIEQSFETTIDEFVGKTKKEIQTKSDENIRIGKYDYLGTNPNLNLIFDDKMEMGGATFKDKVNAISKRLEGKKVPTRLKKDYGVTYDKKEAKQAGQRIAGSMIQKLKMKMKNK